MTNRLENLEHVNEKIAALIRAGGGFVIGRNGSTELQTLFQGSPAERLEQFSGFFPSTPESLRLWREYYVKCLPALRICATKWYTALAKEEESMMATVAPGCLQIPLRGLEPYYVAPEFRWTRELAGKRVAVVSAFAETAVKQAARAAAVWPEAPESLLPSSTTWIPIKTGFPPRVAAGRAGWPAGVTTWQGAVRLTVDRILEARPDIVLIGCGALGIPIAAAVATAGIGAIVMGGAIQVLFGIKGQRWATHSVIGKFWNDAWVWPAAAETPVAAIAIEGACYWGPAGPV
jgi:hypothetical protein